MVHRSKGHMLKVRNMEVTVNLSGLINHHSLVIFTKTIFKAKVYIIGQTAVNIQEIGLTIKCMVMVSSHGQMAEDMKVIILKIKSTDMESFTGLITETIMVVGQMENKMVLVFIHYQVEILNTEDG